MASSRHTGTPGEEGRQERFEESGNWMVGCQDQVMVPHALGVIIAPLEVGHGRLPGCKSDLAGDDLVNGQSSVPTTVQWTDSVIRN
jgi:hypothetical protein